MVLIILGGTTSICVNNQKGGQKMVRWMRSAKIAPGKYLQAMEFAKGISEFSQKYEGASSVGVFLDSFGDVGIIRWFVDYENLASFEKISDQIMADPEWFKKIEEATDLFIAGCTSDVVMRSI